MTNFTLTIGFIVLLTTSCAKNPDATPTRSALTEANAGKPESRSEPASSTGSSSSESVSAEPLARCTALPVSIDDPKLAPQSLTSAEQNRVTFIDDFAKKNASAPNATTRVPPAINGSPHELLWDVPSAKYERARLYFEKQHYPEAALAFHEFTFAHQEKAEALYTSQLYLQSLNLLGAHAKRSECYDAMAEDLPRFRELFCKTPIAPDHAEYCQVLERITRDLQKLRGR